MMGGLANVPMIRLHKEIGPSKRKNYPMELPDYAKKSIDWDLNLGYGLNQK
jgi:hypothetical protein